MRGNGTIHTFLRPAAAFALVLVAACDGAGGGPFVGPGGSNGRTPQAVVVTPEGRSVQSGATLQFQARGIMSGGDTAVVSVDWSATGGSITSGGLFTAGGTAGAFRVIARAAGGVADTVAVNVTVPSANPTLIGIAVTPPNASVAAGGTMQFAATGRLSNGGSQVVNVTWTSTGGTISGAGTYTAGALPGSFFVVATGPGGLADSATVTITGPGTP